MIEGMVFVRDGDRNHRDGTLNSLVGIGELGVLTAANRARTKIR